MTDYSPFISVIIPVYNVSASYLLRAVHSVLQQTYRHWEMLLIDDCSDREDTLETLNDLSSGSLLSGKIKVLHNTSNCGIGAARNRGIREADGEWLCFLDDDDDYYLPGYMEHFIQAIKDGSVNGREESVIVAGYEEVNESGEKVALIPADDQLFNAEDWNESNGMVWSRFYRRSFLIQQKLFFPEGCYTEDSSFLLGLIPYRMLVGVNRNRDYIYCVHDSSTTRGSEVRRLSAAQLPFDYVNEILKQYQYTGDIPFIRAALDQIVTMGVWMCYRSSHRERIRISRRTGILIRSMLQKADLLEAVRNARNSSGGKLLVRILIFSSAVHLQVPVCLICHDVIRFWKRKY